MGEKRNGDIVRTPEERRPLGGPRCRWKGIIKMKLRDIEWGSIN
jgi:hypothetical protein